MELSEREQEILKLYRADKKRKRKKRITLIMLLLLLSIGGYECIDMFNPCQQHLKKK